MGLAARFDDEYMDSEFLKNFARNCKGSDIFLFSFFDSSPLEQIIEVNYTYDDFMRNKGLFYYAILSSIKLAPELFYAVKDSLDARRGCGDEVHISISTGYKEEALMNEHYRLVEEVGRTKTSKTLRIPLDEFSISFYGSRFSENKSIGNEIDKQGEDIKEINLDSIDLVVPQKVNFEICKNSIDLIGEKINSIEKTNELIKRWAPVIGIGIVASIAMLFYIISSMVSISNPG
ncbi:MAG: hypothetical protein B7Y07_01835 [Halothiobacillus sp. 24-54-40]|nr:MAG: hypothetical protein B7X12_03685 [Halothiobacillus sp. 20-53-49]OYZ88074.1 MAG: hypothetical protein B7Y07_01835 [Halothiobacillus sp. 24-54-40]OZA81539.1 MAG: hypothetical protein B7X64_00880 [Halothiobacillus sp. 39-53-45]